MNKSRRKLIKNLVKDLEAIKIKYSELSTTVEGLHLDLESIINEEQESFDNMPEGLQGSEKGEAIEECISILEDALSNIEDMEDELKKDDDIEELIKTLLIL